MKRFKVGDRVVMTRVVSEQITDIEAVVVSSREGGHLTISFKRDPGFGWDARGHDWCWNVCCEDVTGVHPQLELFKRGDP